MLSRLLAVCLLLCLSAGSANSGATQDKLAPLMNSLRSAVTDGDQGLVRAALEALAALSEGELGQCIDPLRAEYAGVATREREAQSDVIETRYQLERRQGLLEELKLREEHDPGLRATRAVFEKELKELDASHKRAEQAVKSSGALREILATGLESLCAKLGPARRSKALDGLWNEAEKGADLEQRLGAIQLAGDLGASGSALRLQKLLQGLEEERDTLLRNVEKSEAEARVFEKRMQEEAQKSGGAVPAGTTEQYERAKSDAAGRRGKAYHLGWLMDACELAGGRALSREAPEQQQQSAVALLKASAKSKSTLKTRTFELLANCDSAAVRAALRAELAKEKEPAARADLLRALGGLRDEASLSSFGAELSATEWVVRSAAVGALAKLRTKACIPPLIAALETAEGRLRTEIASALEELSGMRFGAIAANWQRWWKENEASFEPAESIPELDAAAEAREQMGLSFFGIRTESQRVLFVLDLSGSMNFAMVPRNNPDDRQGTPPDLPREGQDSRLDAARRELTRALSAIKDNGIFNLVLYGSDVWLWADEPQVMEPKNRAEVLQFVDRVTAVGGTNIYGALQLAFNVAGVEPGAAWSKPAFDTIFLLTDGKPSVGILTSPDEILAYVRERNRNAGIVIHTIGLSGAQDAYLLRSLAEQNGGTYAAR